MRFIKRFHEERPDETACFRSHLPQPFPIPIHNFPRHMPAHGRRARPNCVRSRESGWLCCWSSQTRIPDGVGSRDRRHVCNQELERFNGVRTCSDWRKTWILEQGLSGSQRAGL